MGLLCRAHTATGRVFNSHTQAGERQRERAAVVIQLSITSTIAHTRTGQRIRLIAILVINTLYLFLLIVISYCKRKEMIDNLLRMKDNTGVL